MAFNQNLSQFSFVPRSIKGEIIGASGVEPTGSDGYYYFEICRFENGGSGASNAAVTNISANLNGYVSGSGSGKRVGVIAYDYVNARWSCMFTEDVNLVGPNGYLNDKQAIIDFIASLSTPQTIDAANDQLSYPASFAPIHG